MTKLFSQIREYKFQRYHFLYILIIETADLLRFYQFDLRWAPYADQSGFALVTRHAVSSLSLPLLGPFSSAGPFQTGGEWYWIVMLGYLLNPNWAFSPWFVITLFSVGFVGVAIWVGKYYKDVTFALFFGMLALVSVGENVQGTNLTNQTPLSWVSLIVLYFSIRYIRNRSHWDLFFMGLCASLGMSIHLQGASLFILILTSVLVTGLPTIKSFLLLVIAVALPWMPVLFIDMQRGFENTRNMLYYLVFNPDKIPFEALGRRWKTFIIEFVPHSFARGVGGNPYLAVVAILGIGTALLVRFRTKTIPREIVAVVLSVLGMYILLRYTRTPLFESFYVFLHPLILFLSAWFLYELYLRQKIVGVIIFILLFSGSLLGSIHEIGRASSITEYVNGKVATLIGKNPQKKFSVYDFEYKQSAQSLTLSLFLDSKKLVEENGMKIGVIATQSSSMAGPIIVGKPGDVQYIDLSSYTNEQLKKLKWVRVNPQDVYVSTQRWYIDN